MTDCQAHTNDTTTARREGCASDGSYSREAFALMLTTLAGCRFDDPTRTIARCLDIFAGRTPRTVLS